MNNETKISKALELSVKGLSATKIKNVIEDNFGYPSLRTVQYWLAKINKLPFETIQEDSPIKWHLLDRLGFDWEVGNLLYQLANEDGETPSIRYVRWCTRIRAARPDAPIKFIEKIARKCVINDHAEILGFSKFDREDIWRIITEAEFPEGIGVELNGTYMLVFLEKEQPLPDWIRGGGLLSIVRDDHGTTVVCAQNDAYLNEAKEINLTAWKLNNTDVSTFGTDRGIPVHLTSTDQFCYLLTKRPT